MPSGSTSGSSFNRTALDSLAAEESRQLLAAIIESSQDAIISQDLGGMVTSWNRSAERLFGFTAGEMVGEAIQRIIPPDRREEERRIVSNVRAGIPVDHYETSRLTKSGKLISVSLSVSPMRNDDGVIAGVSMVARDISRELTAQAAIRESERRFRALADSAPVMIWMSGPSKEGVYFNKGWLDFTGVPLEQQLGERWLEAVHPEDQVRLADECMQAFIARRTFMTQFRLRRADGEYRWVLDTGAPRFGSKGELLGFIGSCMDITEQKVLEDDLRRSEALFRAVFDGSSVFIVMADPVTGRYLRVNQKFCEMTGYTEAEAQELTFGELTHPEDRERDWEAYQRLVRGEIKEYTVEKRYLRKDRESIWLRMHCVIIRDAAGNPVHDVAIAEDITEWQAAQEAVRVSELRFRGFAENSADVMWIMNSEDRRLLFISPSFESVWGRSVAEFYEDSARFTEAIVPEDREQALAGWRRCGHEVSEQEFRIVRPDGNIVWIRDKGFPIRDEHGKVLYIAGVAADITAQKEVESALRESEERFRTMADNIAQFAWMTDEKGWIFWYNQRWFDYTGTTPEEMAGWGWTKVHHPDHVDRVVEKFRRHIDEGLGWEDTFPLRSKEGAYRWFLSRAFPVRDAEGRVLRWFGTNTDITEQRKVEEALRHSEARLRELNDTLEHRVAERTGSLQRQTRLLRLLANELTDAEQRERKKLATTLHDGLQQTLVAIKMHLPIAARGDGDEALEKVTVLVNEAIHASRTLAYELSPPILANAPFGKAIQWLADWFRDKHRFAITVLVAEELPELPENLKSFLFNAARELLLNAVKHAGVSEAKLRLYIDPADQLRLDVEDRGRGFDPAGLVAEISESYGFGLFSIEERLKALGGGLDIHSAPGAGTRFGIWLPIAEAQQAEELPGHSLEGAAQKNARRAKGNSVLRVLLVDDHQIVREGLLQMMSAEEGIEVIGEAADGYEAIEKTAALEPDIVVMDINMPRLDGIEATRRIKSQHPEVHVVGLSLHEERDVEASFLSAGASAYLRKDGPSDRLFETLRKLCGRNI